MTTPPTTPPTAPEIPVATAEPECPRDDSDGQNDSKDGSPSAENCNAAAGPPLPVSEPDNTSDDDTGHNISEHKDNDKDNDNTGDSVSHDEIRRANFSGSIPVRLALAQTSLSSAEAPRPFHALVRRQTFLHLGLERAVRALHEYAPQTLAIAKGGRVVVQEDDDEQEQPAGETDARPEEPERVPPYPTCWFEDVSTGQPLRWQYFAGVLFDSLQSENGGSKRRLPWELRLHFGSYPSDRLLELPDDPDGPGVLGTLRHAFQNSLKQGLVLQHGTPKAALNLSKKSHVSIWEEGVRDGNYEAVRPVLFPGNPPPGPGLAAAEGDNGGTGGDSLAAGKTVGSTPAMVPVRLSLDPAKPMVQRRIDGGGRPETEAMTLGSLLQEWAPDRFAAPWPPPPCVWVAGIAPPLDTPVLCLWRTLRHPDNFLYVCVSGRRRSGGTGNGAGVGGGGEPSSGGGGNAHL
ncbi:unnamed protein product [Pseudo-nitzschia multistriata]|uniref:Autophagy protein 5 n=1 Tax=Pseudo-nitzschia multistriata TaxID=183589 RepID=A0A448Z491_9STRA|nr:unnamed protein product [Pseudo-nitzschia multistriata]